MRPNLNDVGNLLRAQKGAVEYDLLLRLCIPLGLEGRKDVICQCLLSNAESVDGYGLESVLVVRSSGYRSAAYRSTAPDY